MNDPRDALMLGRTIKTTGITVLRADLAKGKDWWVCRCPCGREFVAQAMDGGKGDSASSKKSSGGRPSLRLSHR
jgi:hypothetical protein